MGVPIQVWRARIGSFSPNKQGPGNAKFGANGDHGRTLFRGGPSVTIRLLFACALLLVASGIEPNPGPATPRVVLPKPCDEPLVTPQRRPTTKSTSNDAEATPPVTCCMQCKRTTPDQSTIPCSLCHESIHLGCLKAGNYLEGQGWRKQEPPQYICQLFNSPSFKFICHSCVSKPSPILQYDTTIASTVRTIENKLDFLTTTMIGNILNDTTHQSQPSFAEVTAKAVARSIEQTRPQEQHKPDASATGEIASALWHHIEKRQTQQNNTDDMKRTIVVTGAPYDETTNQHDRRRVDITFAKELVVKLGIDPGTIQRVFHFRKRQNTDRSPLLTITFMTETTRDEILTEARCLRDIPELSSVRVRPSLPQATRDRRDALYYGATHTTINPDKIVKCVYNARSEDFELRFLLHDDERNVDRIDWQTSVPHTEAALAKWSAAVKANRKTTTPAATRERRNAPATSNR